MLIVLVSKYHFPIKKKKTRVLKILMDYRDKIGKIQGMLSVLRVFKYRWTRQRAYKAS